MFLLNLYHSEVPKTVASMVSLNLYHSQVPETVASMGFVEPVSQSGAAGPAWQARQVHSCVCFQAEHIQSFTHGCVKDTIMMELGIVPAA